jgi:uncharacterized membrane protein
VKDAPGPPRLPAFRWRVRQTIGHDEGSTLILTVFFAGLALAVILVVVAATSLYLERKRLFTVADGAALAGAEAFDLQEVQITDGAVRVTLNSAAVQETVARHLEALPRETVTELAIEQAGTIDGRSATVTLSATWYPPLASMLVPQGIRIEVTSVARSVFF